MKKADDSRAVAQQGSNDFRGLVLFLVLFVLSLVTSRAEAITKNQAADALKKIVQGGVTVIETRKSPLPNISEIIVEKDRQKGVIYITNDLRYVFFGQMIDLKERKNLTSETISEFTRVDVSRLPLADAIRIGSGKRVIYIFEDPDCPYCKKLHGELNSIKDLTTYIFLFPLPSHPDAYGKSKAVWCSKNRAEAFNEAMEGKEIKGDCKTDVVDKNIKLGESLGIRGTPTIILHDGRVIGGFVPAEELEKLIKGAAENKR